METILILLSTHNRYNIFSSSSTLHRSQGPYSPTWVVRPQSSFPVHHISPSSCRHYSASLSPSSSCICLTGPHMCNTWMTLIALLYSQLSMVDVRARKSSVTEKRTGEQNNFKIHTKQAVDVWAYRDHWLFGIWGIWYQESYTGPHQLTASTQACFNLGGQNALEVTTAPSKVW